MVGGYESAYHSPHIQGEFMRCEDCEYAEWDYCEYYGGHRQYFVSGCKKSLSPEDDECEEHIAETNEGIQ